MEFPVLETERLILRELTEGDAGDLFANFSDQRVMKYYGSEAMENIEEAVGLIHSFHVNFCEKRGVRWGIEVKSNGLLIGTVGFHAWSAKNKRAEIGYELNTHYWGQGLAKEAISRAMSYGFNEMGLKRIGAVVFLQNESSNELLLKLGFRKEGILRSYMIQNGIAYDTNIYSKLAE
ncbi:GNAT family N-acetyltransferase [Mesobacillus subterraneus]|uniref:N-acetyltransferase n=1 Tax=Mesobacillus subterraneus TaxID=285983 RepID=A0A427TM79_9BACI|nr:GNAT family protein [Mesobacillus subterraneus]RSD25441.1 N-acetyltransferase [Mesobacillus subterraneus]